jgi:hypothetical protein
VVTSDSIHRIGKKVTQADQFITKAIKELENHGNFVEVKDKISQFTWYPDPLPKEFQKNRLDKLTHNTLEELTYSVQKLNSEKNTTKLLNKVDNTSKINREKKYVSILHNIIYLLDSFVVIDSLCNSVNRANIFYFLFKHGKCRWGDLAAVGINPLALRDGLRELKGLKVIEEVEGLSVLNDRRYRRAYRISKEIVECEELCYFLVDLATLKIGVNRVNAVDSYVPRKKKGVIEVPPEELEKIKRKLKDDFEIKRIDIYPQLRRYGLKMEELGL